MMQSIAYIILFAVFAVVVVTVVFQLLSWAASTPEERERRKENSMSPSEALKRKAKKPTEK